jgi:uncharacterized membrane protein YjgN (DUF898 family)
MQLQVTDQGEHPPEFASNWSQWLRLAAINLLLTIVTLGIYRFWARTRERRYLWSATSWGGEPLDYTGQGRELLIGTMLVFVLFLLPAALAGVTAEIATGLGMPMLALGLNLAVYAVVAWLWGFAVWRSLRYRLSRTRWSGIRGAMAGSATPYAVLHMKMLLLRVVTLGFASPYASVRLFNARWSDARFGSMAFVADAQWRPLMRMFLVNWGLSLVILFGALVGLGLQVQGIDATAPPDTWMTSPVIAATLLYLGGAALLVALLMARYHAAQWRALVGGLSLDGLGFSFTASAWDWLRYWAGNAALVVFTFGVGGLMLQWRKWQFLVGHVQAAGGLDLERLAQTRIEAPIHGEGLADVLDMGGL